MKIPSAVTTEQLFVSEFHRFLVYLAYLLLVISRKCMDVIDRRIFFPLLERNVIDASRSHLIRNNFSLSVFSYTFQLLTGFPLRYTRPYYAHSATVCFINGRSCHLMNLSPLTPHSPLLPEKRSQIHCLHRINRPSNGAVSGSAWNSLASNYRFDGGFSCIQQLPLSLYRTSSS